MKKLQKLCIFKIAFFQPWILQTFTMAKLGRGLLGGHGPSAPPSVSATDQKPQRRKKFEDMLVDEFNSESTEFCELGLYYKLRICVTVLTRIPACDGRTDGRTSCDGIVRAIV